MSVEELLGRLKDVRQTGPNQWQARCPAHDDQKPSLSIKVDSGRILLYCHAGCSTKEILHALGLTGADLFLKHNGKRIAATYDYRDANGELLYQVVRFEPKGFAQRRPNGKGRWVWNLRGVRRVLYRLPELLAADLGITGANFLVAETGTVVLLENEGNIRFTTTSPETHIVLAGVEKILPRMEDLATFLPLLPRSATGQRATAYVSLVSGPLTDLTVVLYDGGRTRLLADAADREVLRCIRCGACLNVCPVYRTVGGHAYGWTVPGPIGAILTPLLRGRREDYDLPFLSSLCGACSEICPVRIDLPGGYFTFGMDVATPGECHRTSDEEVRCRVPAGSEGRAVLTTRIEPPVHPVRIEAVSLPTWAEFHPVTGYGVVTTACTFVPPLGAVGTTAELRFRAMTLDLGLSLELTLYIEVLPPESESPE